MACSIVGPFFPFESHVVLALLGETQRTLDRISSLSAKVEDLTANAPQLEAFFKETPMEQLRSTAKTDVSLLVYLV